MCVLCTYTCISVLAPLVVVTWCYWYVVCVHVWVCVLYRNDIEAAERRELERKKIEEKTTLKKLQKLIEKEQRRKNKMSSSKKTNKYVLSMYM